MMGLVNVTADSGTDDSYAKIAKYQRQQCWRGDNRPAVAFNITGNFTANRYKHTLGRWLSNKTFFGSRVLAFVLAKIQGILLIIPGGRVVLSTLGLAIVVFVVASVCCSLRRRSQAHFD